jgi:hypothetical protein
MAWNDNKKRLNSDHTDRPCTARISWRGWCEADERGYSVGLVDQLLAPGGSFHTVNPFLYQIDAQSWPFVVRNSLAKVNKNEVIAFLIPDIHQIPFVGALPC